MATSTIQASIIKHFSSGDTTIDVEAHRPYANNGGYIYATFGTFVIINQNGMNITTNALLGTAPTITAVSNTAIKITVPTYRSGIVIGY